MYDPALYLFLRLAEIRTQPAAQRCYAEGIGVFFCCLFHKRTESSGIQARRLDFTTRRNGPRPNPPHHTAFCTAIVRIGPAPWPSSSSPEREILHLLAMPPPHRRRRQNSHNPQQKPACITTGNL